MLSLYKNKLVLVAVGLIVGTLLLPNFVHADQKIHKRLKKDKVFLGTSDGAGGNAIDGKMIEDHIFQPELSPAFTPKLKRILDTLFVVDKDNKFDSIAILKVKSWYKTKRKLKAIEKRNLGISFVEGDIEQAAIKNDAEVWIDDNIYSSMDVEIQSHVILHEVVMTIYLNQFMKYSDLLRLWERATGIKTSFKNESGQPTFSSLEDVDKLFPPAPKRELTEVDYQNVRYMTNWLLDQKPGAFDSKKFDKIACLSGFDQRTCAGIESEENDSKAKNQPIKYEPLRSEQLMLKLNSTLYSNTLPNECHTEDSGSTYPCEISWSIQEQDNPLKYVNNLKSKFLILNVVNSQTKQNILTTSLFLSESSLSIHNEYFGPKQYQVYSLAGYGSPIDKSLPWNLSKLIVGDKTYGITFYFDSTKERLIGISMIPFVLADISKVNSDQVPNLAKGNTPGVKIECDNFHSVKFHGDKPEEEGLHWTDKKEIIDFRHMFRNLGENFDLYLNCHDLK